MPALDGGRERWQTPALPMAAQGIRDPRAYPDREQAWRVLHLAHRFRDVGALVTDALVAEHAANPLGLRPHFHSPALQRVVNTLRTHPIRARYELLDAGGAFDLIAIERGAPPAVVPGVRYATFEDAVHGLFLRRIAELRSLLEGGDA
jgi:branched-chain amino acid transport system permease protein